MHPLSLTMSTNITLLFHVVPSRDWFTKTLNTIGKLYRYISIEDVESYYYGNTTFNGCCHICFDDSDASFYDIAYPVLRKMRLPTTLFISPQIIINRTNYWFQDLGWIIEHLDDYAIKLTICETLKCQLTAIKNYSVYSVFKCMKLEDIKLVLNAIKKKHHIDIDKKFNMTEEQLCEVRQSGIVTIAAHTVNHPILSNESLDNAEREIRDSVEGVSKMTGADVKYFAYPNGTGGLDFGERERSILRDIGIKLAFSTDKGFFNARTDPLAIPRGLFSREKHALIFSELCLFPVWGRIRGILRPGKNVAKVEALERINIKKLSLLN